MRFQKMLFAAAVLLAVSPALAQTAQTYSDPIPYCKAIGTIDKPDARCTGPKLPVWIAAKLNMQPDQGKLMEWPCADGAVLACQYGASIPCDSKAAASKEPSQPIIDYCRQNTDSQFVPIYVTGHNTSISWACHGSQPVVTRSAEVDAQGYQKDYWHRVSP